MLKAVDSSHVTMCANQAYLLDRGLYALMYESRCEVEDENEAIVGKYETRKLSKNLDYPRWRA
jgi:hypothetical protein